LNAEFLNKYIPKKEFLEKQSLLLEKNQEIKVEGVIKKLISL
jgi:hypothetical protein